MYLILLYWLYYLTLYNIKYILRALRIYPEIIKNINISDIDYDVAIQCIDNMYNIHLY